MTDQVNETPDATPEVIDLEAMSKYELVMIAAREARRLNDRARASGKELKRRVTEVAWERLQDGKIKHTYGEVPYEEEPVVPLDEAVMAEINDDLPEVDVEVEADGDDENGDAKTTLPVEEGA